MNPESYFDDTSESKEDGLYNDTIYAILLDFNEKLTGTQPVTLDLLDEVQNTLKGTYLKYYEASNDENLRSLLSSLAVQKELFLKANTIDEVVAIQKNLRGILRNNMDYYTLRDKFDNLLGELTLLDLF
jgi:hypothetical protein